MKFYFVFYGFMKIIGNFIVFLDKTTKIFCNWKKNECNFISFFMDL